MKHIYLTAIMAALSAGALQGAAEGGPESPSSGSDRWSSSASSTTAVSSDDEAPKKLTLTDLIDAAILGDNFETLEMLAAEQKGSPLVGFWQYVQREARVQKKVAIVGEAGDRLKTSRRQNICSWLFGPKTD
jgi:hypothetical protein